MAMIMVISVTVVLAGSAADKDTKTKEPVIIGFKSTPGHADKAMVRGRGGDITYSYRLINAIAAKLPEPAIENIQRNPRVTYVEIDGEVHTLDTELDNSWGVERIGAGNVHAGGNKGAGVNVAIIDTGIDYTHLDLEDNFDTELLGYDFVNGDSDPMDDNGHGTHCAGIVAAVDNGGGVVGVAPEAHLYAVKVLNSVGSGSVSDVIAGIQWSVANGMQVISMSFGGGDGVGMKAACDAAYNAGIVVVASAGNSGNPAGKGDNVDYPARYDSVIAVAATDSSDNRARWSSTGPAVELAAPGVSIKSTYLGGGYAIKSGTSMACPHVTGTAALVIAAGGDVRQCLKDTADDLGPTGFDTKYGFGLVDADGDALPDTTPPIITNVASSAITSASATITWDTDELADSLVKYGIESGNYNLDAYDSADVAAHSVVLTELQSDTQYYYVVTSIDSSGNSAQSSEHTFTTTKEASGNSMHVNSIDMSRDSKTRGRNTFVWAVATVTILDESESPVEGATISGHWSGATTDSDSGVTDASGQVSLESDSVKNPPSETTFTFTVDDVTKNGWTYKLDANEATSASTTV
jgi:subtilisin family serine protease